MQLKCSSFFNTCRQVVFQSHLIKFYFYSIERNCNYFLLLKKWLNKDRFWAILHAIKNEKWKPAKNYSITKNNSNVTKLNKNEIK